MSKRGRCLWELPNNMKEFELNNTIYFECKYRDFDGSLQDPTTPAYKVYDSKMATKTSGTPTKKADGVYYFYYKPTTVDTYIVEFTGTIGGQAGLARDKFKVTETIVQ